MQQSAVRQWVQRTLWLALLALGGSLVVAQQERPVQERAPLLNRGNLQRPELRVERTDPRMDAILAQWSEATSKIKKLSGEHLLAEQNFVDNVETRSEG